MYYYNSTNNIVDHNSTLNAEQNINSPLRCANKIDNVLSNEPIKPIFL